MADPQVPIAAVLGDGPYWFSALEILTTPIGVSFYRRFDYRDTWVSADLAVDVPEGGSRTYETGLVGLRCYPRIEGGQPDPAQAEVARSFIPLRWIQKTVISRSGHYVTSMVLGDYVSTDAETGDLAHLEIPEALNRHNGDPILLRYATPDEEGAIEGLGRRETPDSRLWQYLATSELLSTQCREYLRNQVVPYATSVVELKDRKVLGRVKLGTHSGDVVPTVGYKLKVGRAFGVNLEMRRIIEPGKPESQAAARFGLVNDPKDVAASNRQIPFTGNYRRSPLWVRPLRHQPAPLDLWIDPLPMGDRPPETQIGLRIPFTVGRAWPVLQTVLAFILLATGAAAFTFALRADPETASYGIAMALATLAISTGVAVGASVARTWEGQNGAP